MTQTPELHMVGANGFPANTYQHLIDQLDCTQRHYLNLIAHPYKAGFFTWDSIANEIIHNIETVASGPVIGIGHSNGAVTTYLASQKRPDLFSQLILIEPVFFKPVYRLAMAAMNLFKPKQNAGHMYKQASVRKELFDSRDHARDYFAGKSLFKEFSSESLDAYVEHGIKDIDNGCTLTFDRRVEAKIFATLPTRVAAAKHTLPTHVLFGQTSDLSRYLDIAYWRKNFGEDSILFNPGGHLFPFEDNALFVELLEALIHQNSAFIQQHENLFPSRQGFTSS
ncbi:MAG: alpha/beta hydrolase [Pseudomonadota bacterium]